MSRRVALVHHWLVGQRGGERVLARLAERFPGAELFTLLHDADAAPAPPRIARVRTSALQGVPGAGRVFRVLLPLLPALYARLPLHGVDLVVSSDASVAKCVRVPDGVPHVCYCYSPPRYAHDLRELYLAESVPAALRPLARRLLRGVAARDREAAQRVTQFVAISNTVAARIRRAYDRDAVVIPPPVDTEFFTPAEARDDASHAHDDVARRVLADLGAGAESAAAGDTRPYLLAGAAVPYKRFEVAVDACRELDRALVVAGGGPRFDALRRRAGPRTRFVASPSDAELRALYRGCRALLFPGEEDFGLVPVEAMACGAPVIAWGVGGAAETVRHGETGVLYDVPATNASPDASTPTPAPHAAHVHALSDAIRTFERAAHDFTPAACRRRAEHFATSRFSAALDTLLTRVIGADVRSSAQERTPGAPP